MGTPGAEERRRRSSSFPVSTLSGASLRRSWLVETTRRTVTEEKPSRAKKRLASRLEVGTFDTTISQPACSALDRTAAIRPFATPWRLASEPPPELLDRQLLAVGLEAEGVLAS